MATRLEDAGNQAFQPEITEYFALITMSWPTQTGVTFGTRDLLINVPADATEHDIYRAAFRLFASLAKIDLRRTSPNLLFYMAKPNRRRGM